jgi:hypothetical protein
MLPFRPIDSRFAIVDATVAARLQKVFNSKHSCLVIWFLMLQATLRILRLSFTQEINNDNTKADGRRESGHRDNSQVLEDSAAPRAREKSEADKDRS